MHKRQKTFVGQLIETGAVAKASLSRGMKSSRQYFLVTAALICLTAAGFTHSIWLGLVVAGISFFFLEWRVGEK